MVTVRVSAERAVSELSRALAEFAFRQSAWSRLKLMRLSEIARDRRSFVAPQGALEDDYFGYFAVEKLRGFSAKTAELENISLIRGT